MPEPVVDPLEEVAALFDLWNTTLQTGDPEKVASLYAPDGVLLPTVSNKVRPDHASKVDYFTAFLQLKPFGTINESHVRFLNTQKTLAANSGVYTFQLQKPDGPAAVSRAPLLGAGLLRKFGSKLLLAGTLLSAWLLTVFCALLVLLSCMSLCMSPALLAFLLSPVSVCAGPGPLQLHLPQGGRRVEDC
jgi:uncharacterized protein (TIGR02246 family)